MLTSVTGMRKKCEEQQGAFHVRGNRARMNPRFTTFAPETLLTGDSMARLFWREREGPTHHGQDSMNVHITLVFSGNNRELLSDPAPGGRVRYTLDRRASIKDIIEALGVPHTEIFRLEQGGKELSFQFVPSGGEEILVLPFADHDAWQEVSALRPQPFEHLKFLVDLTALKLARNLRMLGLDTATAMHGDLRDIAQKANREKRIVITRNRELLKIGDLLFGQLLRSDDHRKQLSEVEGRYRVSAFAKPMSRCLVCNEILQHVPKADIEHRLKPLTKKYYHRFKACAPCEKLYWQGSHHARMMAMLDSLPGG